MRECETIVVGAGLAGLVLASELARSGADVLVLEKSRGLGGRMATRRTDAGTFDHGAQYLRPETPQFHEFLTKAEVAGAATQWEGLPEAGAYVGLPGMSGLVSPSAEGLEIRFQSEVAAAELRLGRWSLNDNDGHTIAICDRLVLAIPAPQAHRLLGTHPAASPLAACAYMPCWTLMAAFREYLDLPQTSHDYICGLSWIARDSSKPGRSTVNDMWVIQADPEWSKVTLERDRTEICKSMLSAFSTHCGGLPEPVYASAHRWRYALVAEPLGASCLVDAESKLIAVGDWCLGPRAEHAFLSGRAGAEALSRL